MRKQEAAGDPEHLEDYLELEHYIEGLQVDQSPRRPHQLSPSQVGIYQVAALFRAAAPDATVPDACFVETLRGRLETLLHYRLG